MFRRAFDKRAERRMRRHKSTPSQLSLFSRVSSSKKKKTHHSPQKSLKQPFTTTTTLTLTITTVEEFGKKKKSKKKKKLALSDDEEGGGENEEEEKATTSSSGGGVQSGLGLPWDGSDRDYHYDELLGRVFGILKEKNPALSEKTKTIIKPPQIAREGTKKTVFANLMEICNAMHRPHEHVTQYMMAELGTTGTLDGQQRLIIKGRFLPKVFEGVLRHYFIDYVICNMCKSSDTQLVKEATTRLSYCRCQSCGASRSVSNIQKGYTAVGRGERRKARAMGT
jgi:translation initiation factor 2 subunit 2